MDAEGTAKLLSEECKIAFLLVKYQQIVVTNGLKYCNVRQLLCVTTPPLYFG